MYLLILSFCHLSFFLFTCSLCFRERHAHTHTHFSTNTHTIVCVFVFLFSLSLSLSLSLSPLSFSQTRIQSPYPSLSFSFPSLLLGLSAAWKVTLNTCLQICHPSEFVPITFIVPLNCLVPVYCYSLSLAQIVLVDSVFFKTPLFPLLIFTQLTCFVVIHCACCVCVHRLLPPFVCSNQIRHVSGKVGPTVAWKGNP